MMKIRKNKEKDEGIADVKNFIEMSKKSKGSKKRVNKYFKYVVFVILTIIFILIVFFQMDRADGVLISELKHELEIKQKMINRIFFRLEKKKEELKYFYFKDFYYSVTDKKMTDILFLIWKYSKINKINPYHVLLIMSVESGFNPRARSNMGAYGLMQVHYVTWKVKYDIKNPEDLYNVEFNIRLGCEIFKHYLGKADNDFGRAGFLYNTGRLGFLDKYENDYILQIQRNKFYQGME